MSKKKYEWCNSYVFFSKELKKEVVINTQLYTQAQSVYIIQDNNPATQGGINIKGMAKLHKRLLKEEEKEEITNLVKGRLIQVEIENGVLTEIK